MNELESYGGIPIVRSPDYTAELVQLVRNWLAESPMSERMSQRRCRELLAICDEYSGDKA